MISETTILPNVENKYIPETPESVKYKLDDKFLVVGGIALNIKHISAVQRVGSDIVIVTDIIDKWKSKPRQKDGKDDVVIHSMTYDSLNVQSGSPVYDYFNKLLPPEKRKEEKEKGTTIGAPKTEGTGDQKSAHIRPSKAVGSNKNTKKESAKAVKIPAVTTETPTIMKM